MSAGVVFGAPERAGLDGWGGRQVGVSGPEEFRSMILRFWLSQGVPGRAWEFLVVSGSFWESLESILGALAKAKAENNSAASMCVTP